MRNVDFDCVELDAADLEAATVRIMSEQGTGRHQAHILACRELLGEDDRVSGRRNLNRVAGLAVIGLFSLSLGLGTGAMQALAGDRGSFPGNLCPGSKCPDNARPKETAGECPVDKPGDPLCTPKG